MPATLAQGLLVIHPLLAGLTWSSHVEGAGMTELIDHSLSRERKTRFATVSTPQEREDTTHHTHTTSHRRTNGDSHAPVVVIGGGPTGLSAAYHLGENALLLEQNDRIGGWCRSLQTKGFTFDFAGHIMFSNDPYVHQMYKMLLGDNVHWQDREAWIYSKNVYTRYPFQGALYGLPPDVIKECIVGAIEARFGNLRSSKDAPDGGNGHCATAGRNGHAAKRDGDAAKGDGLQDCCADGILESTARLKQFGTSAPPANFEEFIYKVWGAGIAKHFAIPYNRKLWAVPLSEMETSWLGGRVPMPDLEEMIEGALRPVLRPMGPNARFGYPLRGGFQALMNGFLPHLRGEVRLGARVTQVSPARRTVTTQDGSEISFEQLISTMPLPVLVRLMGDEVPDEVHEAAGGLRFISVRCVHLGIGRENLTEKHWIYYPEDTVFHRIFVQGNASPHCNPPGGFGLTCEITYCPHYKPLPCDGEALIQRCIDDCRKVGFFCADDPIWAAVQVDLPHAYVVYDHARPRNVALIREWLAEKGILLAGRYSEWEYYNSDHAFLAGKKAAETASERLRLAARTTAQGDFDALTLTTSLPGAAFGKLDNS
jgi:UDP-galactopyranose mutase